MLTRAETVGIYFIPHLFSSQGHVRLRVGKKIAINLTKMRVTREEYERLVSGRTSEPLKFRADNKTFWLFEGKFYKDTDSLDVEAVKALLLTRKKLNAQRINRAKTIAAVQTLPTKIQRAKIPDDVRLLVFQRDNGKCVRCGSGTELQIDHIIPVSLGGASTPENLQVLCGSCNRAKGASVA